MTLRNEIKTLKALLADNQKIMAPLIRLGVIDPTGVQNRSVGKSGYHKQTIQPWNVILDYQLNYWDGDIVKRTLRTKVEEGMTPEEQRIQDYEKIQHICDERIRQIKTGVPL